MELSDFTFVFLSKMTARIYANFFFLSEFRKEHYSLQPGVKIVALAAYNVS